MRRSGRLANFESKIDSVARRALAFAALQIGLDSRHEISLLLCDGATIRRINREWRNKDLPTDVLSFPSHVLKPGADAVPGSLGDIVVALPVAKRAAIQMGIPFEDHFAHLLIHGLLHLMGYDHVRDGEAKIMEALERRILAARKRKRKS